MKKKEGHHQVRLAIVLAFCMAGLLGLGVRLYWIQCKKGPQLAARGQRQHQGVIKLQPERGLIYDRGQRVLAMNSGRPCLRLYGKTWQGSGQAVEQLAQAVGVAPEQLQKRIDRILERIEQSEGQIRSGVLIYSIDSEREKAIQGLAIPGLYFSSGTGRVYPNGTLAASVLGFVGLNGKGLEGMERYAEPYLQGVSSSVPTLRDGLGANLFYTDVTEDDSSRGADAILALDQYIQFLAEKELEEVGKKYQPLWASIVVMEPNSAEVLAIANWPTYDPNHVELSVAEERKNYAVCEAYEPGSTVKAFTLAAALEDQIMLPSTPIYCEKGQYRVYRHTIRDDVHSYEWLTLEEVLAHSSNIGAVKVAQLLGQERLYDILSSVGFGRPTGIEFPGESPGLLRPVSRWSGLSIAAIPFGQEMKTTVLGLTNAYCAIANGGMLQTPKLILGYRNPRTGEIRPVDYPAGRRVLSAATTRALTQMLVAVTEYGGGQKAQVPGFQVAGKTGTAQVYDPQIKTYARGRYVSSFVGFLPAENPRVVIAVVVNQPQKAKYGNLVAGPVFASLGAELMRYLEVFPTAPDKKQEIAEALFAAKDPRAIYSALPLPRNPQPGSLVLGMTMREAYETLRLQGIPLKFQGSGVALLQQPVGESETGAPVEVQFFPPPRLEVN